MPELLCSDLSLKTVLNPDQKRCIIDNLSTVEQNMGLNKDPMTGQYQHKNNLVTLRFATIICEKLSFDLSCTLITKSSYPIHSTYRSLGILSAIKNGHGPKHLASLQATLKMDQAPYLIGK